MLKTLKAILSGRSETADAVAAKIAELEQIERDETERIASLRIEHGEALINSDAVSKIEQELDAARLEHARITTALEALRVRHEQLSRTELKARATADLKAAVKAVVTIPTLLTKYSKVAGPVVDALGTMRRMTDAALGLPRSASQPGVTGTLGTARALWREARIPRSGQTMFPLWPADDPDAPRTVVGDGDRRRVGDWPVDLDDAANRAKEALATYERVAPPLRAVVADIRGLNNTILNARRDAVAAGLDVPTGVGHYRTVRPFLNGIVIPECPDDAPRMELLPQHRRRVFSAGVEV